MAKKSYNEIMQMITNACNEHFYSGAKDVKEIVIECATQIYIAQMNCTPKEGGAE